MEGMGSKGGDSRRRVFRRRRWRGLVVEEMAGGGGGGDRRRRVFRRRRWRGWLVEEVMGGGECLGGGDGRRRWR